MSSRAVQLVDVKETASGTALVVSEEGEQFLNSFTRPLAVVVIAGPYRTGKSFLSNQLLGAKNAFTVGHTTTACTRGIWASQCVETVTFGDGSEGDVLVLDTEGLGATDKTSHYDDNIFMLAALLASTMIYNSQGAIDEKSIQKLTFIGKMRDVLKRSQEAAEGSENEDDESDDEGSGGGSKVNEAAIFPAFIWTLRDFSLKLVQEDGQSPMSSDQYMEKQLQDQKGFDMSTQRRNAICQSLRRYFTQRRCFTFCRPADSEEALQSLSTQSESDLRPAFLSQVAHFKKEFWRQLKPKRSFGGRILTGPGFYQIIVQYVQAINAGGVPVVGDAWTAALEAQAKSARKAALASHEAAMHQLAARLPLDEQELQGELQKAHNDALKLYNTRCRGTREEIRLQGAAGLTTDLVAATRQVEEDNRDASMTSCKELLFELMDASNTLLSSAADAPSESEADAVREIPTLWSAWDSCVAEYEGQARGPARDKVLLEHGLRRLRDANSAAAERAAAAIQSTTDALEVQAHETAALERRKAELTEQHEASVAARRELDERLRAAESKVASTDMELAAKQDEISRLERAGKSAQVSCAAIVVC